MRKFLLPLIGLLLCSGNLFSTNGQQARLQEREAEWQNYVLPKTNFARKADADKNIVFRVPADWEQLGESFIFKGPHASSLKILIQDIPEGYPIDDFFAATLQVVKDTLGSSDELVIRRTELQDVEAREMVFEAEHTDGELVRSTAWLAIYGPHAYWFNLQTPAAEAAEIEPYLKAVLQSVAFVVREPRFEALRAEKFKSPAASPIDETENLINSLTGANPKRDETIDRLTALFISQPDAVVDLLIDRRTFVRLAAAQAASQSHNSALTPFLWELLDDREPLVSEAAARGVANTADVAEKTLWHSMSGFLTEKIARVWPFLAMDKRREVLEAIFKRTAVRKDPPPPVQPPPPAKAPAAPSVSVKVEELTPLPPGVPPPMVIAASDSPDVQLGALTLLSTLPPEEFKLPLARIIASNQEPLIAVALQVAQLRGEVLPVPPLLKLLSSSNEQIRKFAENDLAVSASVSDVPQIEALISKDGARKTVDDELKLVIRKINFRHALAAAKSETEKRTAISNALTDRALADFAWRYDCDATVTGCAAGNAALDPKATVNIKPLGENAFPQKMRYYTAIPNPRQAVQRFYQTLNGVQMDSPQSQASLLLTLTNGRKVMALGLSAPADAGELIDYTGIDADAPIALGSWTATNARDGVASAERKAIVLRVKDRAMFERNVANVQELVGGFMRLTEGTAITSRIVATLPAALPFIGQVILSTDMAKTPKVFPVLHYSFVTDTGWNGLKLRLVEHREVANDWTITDNATYIAYLGETAILTPDLASLRDLLANATAAGERQLLADNSEFRQASESHGDVIYFSDLSAIVTKPGDLQSTANESGTLKFSNSTWETSHHLAFAASDWAKPLLPFNPKELTAPRELLPSSTIGYYLMKVDLPAIFASAAWTSRAKIELEAFKSVWALDFKQEVLPELGPECGFTLTDLPDLQNLDGVHWAIFCKLKSNKLADALNAGKLLRGIGPTASDAELKLAGDSYFVGARQGFLVVSNQANVIASFDGKTQLSATRDYLRSIEKVPDGVVAFAGYNLEAAIAAASKGTMEGTRAQIANVLFAFASAFHSQNFYATVTAGTVEAHSSVSMDREGRYAVADFSSLPRNTSITYATIAPKGIPITTNSDSATSCCACDLKHLVQSTTSRTTSSPPRKMSS